MARTKQGFAGKTAKAKKQPAVARAKKLEKRVAKLEKERKSYRKLEKEREEDQKHTGAWADLFQAMTPSEARKAQKYLRKIKALIQKYIRKIKAENTKEDLLNQYCNTAFTGCQFCKTAFTG